MIIPYADRLTLPLGLDADAARPRPLPQPRGGLGLPAPAPAGESREGRDPGLSSRTTRPPTRSPPRSWPRPSRTSRSRSGRPTSAGALKGNGSVSRREIREALADAGFDRAALAAGNVELEYLAQIEGEARGRRGEDDALSSRGSGAQGRGSSSASSPPQSYGGTAGMRNTAHPPKPAKPAVAGYFFRAESTT